MWGRDAFGHVYSLFSFHTFFCFMSTAKEECIITYKETLERNEVWHFSAWYFSEIIIFHNYVVKHNFHKCPRIFHNSFLTVFLFIYFWGHHLPCNIRIYVQDQWKYMWLASWGLIIGESFSYITYRFFQ